VTAGELLDYCHSLVYGGLRYDIKSEGLLSVRTHTRRIGHTSIPKV